MPKGNSRILLVDDDRLVLAALDRGLRAEGYDVEPAGDGGEALSLAGGKPFNLAVVDIRLPDMTGIELAGRLRRQWNLPSLFFSAYDDKALVEEAVAQGGLGYLVKPVNPRHLLPTIDAALARARELNALMQSKERLEQALESGRDTNTAIGILMERRHLSRDEAFQCLRAEARSQRLSVESLAGRLVQAEEMMNTLKNRD